MTAQIFNKLILTIALLVVGIIQVIGGLYFYDKRAKNNDDLSKNYKKFTR